MSSTTRPGNPADEDARSTPARGTRRTIDKGRVMDLHDFIILLESAPMAVELEPLLIWDANTGQHYRVIPELSGATEGQYRLAIERA
ncbi:hypothetical protein GCM10009574_023490 [Streptomyces asiaticus]